MSDRINPEELDEIILEIEKMRSHSETEFTREEVKNVLQELNLSPVYLDEALIQLQRKKALKAQQKTHKLIIMSFLATVSILVGLALFSSQKKRNAIAEVQVQQDRITLKQDNGDDLKAIERQNSSPVFYRVTLKDAPIGKSLDLSCNWISPNSQIIQQNRYQTSKITTSVWNTRCKNTFGSSASVGNWQVQMFVGDRKLSETDFEIK